MRCHRHALRALCGLSLAWFGGCVLVSDVNGFEIVEDAGADADVDADAGEQAVDATVELQAMTSHPTQFVDCAIVDAQERLLGRGMILLPPRTGASYPDVSMTLQGVLVGEAPFDVLFFADVNRNFEVDAPPDDHSWVRPLDDDGVLSFAHTALFDDLTGFDITPIGADLVLDFAGDDDPRVAFSRQTSVIEIHMVAPDGRTTALVQLHPDEDEELPDEVVVRGVIDSGSPYTFVVFADGEPVDGGELAETAPTSGDLVLPLTKTLLGL